MNLLLETYRTVSRPQSDYFRKVWIERNGLSREQFYKRLKNPTLDDVLLFSHVCQIDEGIILKPMKQKFSNVPPFGQNLQLIIETPAPETVEKKIYKPYNRRKQETTT